MIADINSEEYRKSKRQITATNDDSLHPLFHDGRTIGDHHAQISFTPSLRELNRVTATSTI